MTWNQWHFPKLHYFLDLKALFDVHKTLVGSSNYFRQSPAAAAAVYGGASKQQKLELIQKQIPS